MRDLLLISPLWLATATGILALVLDLLAPKKASRGFLGYVVSFGLLLAGFAAVLLWASGPTLSAPYLKDILRVDAFSAFFAVLVLFAGVATAFFSIHHLPEQRAEHGEFYVLLAFSVLGAITMVASLDLVTLFLGLEVMSLATYVLCAVKKSSPYSSESGMKYFVLGGFASAFMLFGIAFIYGTSGSLNLLEAAKVIPSLPSQTQAFVHLAFLMFIVALGFKVAAVPFHFWTPDVYEGAPTPTVVYMAGAVKAAGFAVLSRVILSLFQIDSLAVPASGVFLALSVLSMVVGNILGIVQDNVKRILAYSSIAHAGYILLGLYASDGALNSGVTFYLLTYVIATVGAFGVLALLAKAGVEDLSLDKVAGLGRRHPVLATLLLLSLLSLAGIPPLAGFMGKFYLFREVLRANPSDNVVWVVVAVLNSLIALYYYLRITVYMYFRDPVAEPAGLIRSVPGFVMAGVAATLAIFVGIFPSRFISASEVAAASTVVKIEKVQQAEPASDIVRDAQRLIRSREMIRRLRDLQPPGTGVTR